MEGRICERLPHKWQAKSLNWIVAHACKYHEQRIPLPYLDKLAIAATGRADFFE